MHKTYPKNWILLRGLGRESAHWGDFTRQLQAAFPLATLHTLDLPGCGLCNTQTSPVRIETLVDAVHQTAEAEGMLASPPVLFGLSLGGMVAWQWLHQYPEDACAAVLLNSSFASLSPFYQRLRWQNYAQLARLIQARTAIEKERFLLSLVSNQDDTARSATLSRWTDIRQKRPVSITNELRQIIAAARYRPSPHPPIQPVLLLNSLGDRLVSPACSVAIQQFYHLPLATHPTAGHDLTTDAGEWVVRQLKAWFEKDNNDVPC